MFQRTAASLKRHDVLSAWNPGTERNKARKEEAPSARTTMVMRHSTFSFIENAVVQASDDTKYFVVKSGFVRRETDFGVCHRTLSLLKFVVTIKFTITSEATK